MRVGGWSWMRAIGDRHDQPAGERGPGKSLPAHTTTRPQGRLGPARWMMSEHNISRTCASLVGDAGLAPARPLGTTLFESVLATRFQQSPVTSTPVPAGRPNSVAVTIAGMRWCKSNTEVGSELELGALPDLINLHGCGRWPRVLPDGIEPPSQRLKGARSATELEKHDLPTYPSGLLGSTQGHLSVGRNLCPVLPDLGTGPPPQNAHAA